MEFSKEDRARLFQAVTQENELDPVELIIKKAKAHDDLQAYVKTRFNLPPQDVDLVQLLEIVFGQLSAKDQELKTLISFAKQELAVIEEHKKQHGYGN